jgi:pheromone shutdown protein TraB
MSERNHAANFSALAEMIEIAGKQGIRVALVTTPVLPTFSKFMEPARWERVQQDIRLLASRPGVSYFNYLNDSRFDEHDFEDSDHLNVSGAEKLSLILDREIIRTKLTKLQ